VKATRGNDFFLTITESKKTTDEEGNMRQLKHKIFLYKEDFDKFQEAFSIAVDFIRRERGSQSAWQEEQPRQHYDDYPQPKGYYPMGEGFDDLA